MSIINVTKEKNLDELLSKKRAGLDQVKFKRLRDLTLEINPHLNKEGGLKPDVVIMLPGLRQLHSRSLVAENDIKAWLIIQPLISGIQAHLPQLERKMQSNIKELGGTSKKLNSTQFLNSMDSKKSAEVGTVIKQLKDNVQAEHKTAKAMLSNLRKQADVIPKDLSELFQDEDVDLDFRGKEGS